MVLRRRIFILILVLLLVVNLFISARSISGIKTGSELYKNLELFARIITLVENNYVEEKTTRDLIYSALKGMLRSLDPHSQFLEPRMYKDMRVETEGEFGGLGIEITVRQGNLVIIAPIEDTPAWKVGLKSGDRIMTIDGEPTKNLPLVDVVGKLRGKPGTTVCIEVMRPEAKELKEFVITRAVIKIESIKEVKVLEEKIGYVKITQFQEDTAEELAEALKKLRGDGIESLVLDLRNNPGGLLKVAINVADKFLSTGKIVYTKGRVVGQEMEFMAHKRNTEPDYPLVILINGGSASGSEIVAGAVRDSKRGILLGSKTFGKGSVQSVLPLEDGSALRLTTGRYYTPNGTSIHGTGITPDIVVEMSEELQQALILQRYRDLGIEEESAEKTEQRVVDIQLARAVDLLKGVKIFSESIGLTTTKKDSDEPAEEKVSGVGDKGTSSQKQEQEDIPQPPMDEETDIDTSY